MSRRTVLLFASVRCLVRYLLFLIRISSRDKLEIVLCLPAYEIFMAAEAKRIYDFVATLNARYRPAFCVAVRRCCMLGLQLQSLI